MRKIQQQKVLELLHTLNEANTEIRRFLPRKELSTVSRLLCDCQNTAVLIGNYIERLMGEGTEPVALLEEYCEILYKISVEIDNTGNDAGFIKRLKKQLIKIEGSVKQNLTPDRIEIVFLPYKASMFDSMESVWLEAKDDPQCDAYVIPVPYYDKLPDGTLGRMHYEGDKYPDYVPIVDWKSYNIEERHPDIIVIHNPYDDNNYVTSIHPDFYCKRIKDFTDLLVYIPYFVCIDDVQRHFCVCDGTILADKVIVQSEEIRQTYIREFRKFENKNRCKNGFGNPVTKFVALGSPKFDAIINMKPEACPIPNEWLRLIEKPDGTHKKVILYNNSIAGLLDGKEKVLNKLRYVFDCFRNRDDVVLLWRPHPLNTATYETMRPKLLSEYMEIVAEYRWQGFGIYDDSPDLHRALSVSDAYYGDWSSLVALYQCTGKPAMIQNVDVDNQNTALNNLAFENLFDEGEHFWFTAYNFNALFRMDKTTWQAEYMGSFPDEKPDGWRLYASITANNGKLYFAPLSANEIAVYDLSTQSFSKIAFKNPTVRLYNPAIKFYSTVPYKNWLFFVGFSYPAIMRYDVMTGALEYFSDWVEPLNRLADKISGCYFKDICVTGSDIIMPALCANAVVVFNMDTCISTIHKAGNKRCSYISVCFDGKDYWLVPKHKEPVVKWNLNTKEYKEYGKFPDGFLSCEYSFRSTTFSDGYVWLFPNRANMALKINPQAESIFVADEFQTECIDSKDGAELFSENYMQSALIQNKIYAHTGKTNSLLEYDPITGNIRKEPILLSPEAVELLKPIRTQTFIKNVDSCETEYDCYFYENSFSRLPDFLDYFNGCCGSENLAALHDRQIEIFRSENEFTDGTSGSEIYSYCKQEIFQNRG